LLATTGTLPLPPARQTANGRNLTVLLYCLDLGSLGLDSNIFWHGWSTHAGAPRLQ
jgi:hypothetical protein